MYMNVETPSQIPLDMQSSDEAPSPAHWSGRGRALVVTLALLGLAAVAGVLAPRVIGSAPAARGAPGDVEELAISASLGPDGKLTVYRSPGKIGSSAPASAKETQHWVERDPHGNLISCERRAKAYMCQGVPVEAPSIEHAFRCYYTRGQRGQVLKDRWPCVDSMDTPMWYCKRAKGSKYYYTTCTTKNYGAICCVPSKTKKSKSKSLRALLKGHPSPTVCEAKKSRGQVDEKLCMVEDAKQPPESPPWELHRQ